MARRYDQCDSTCTTDCGHCRGNGPPTEVDHVLVEARAMPALSLWEPWASCVAAGLKEVETRSWRLPRHLLGRRIALGSAKAWHADEVGHALLMLGNVEGALDRLAEHLDGDPWKKSSYPRGCVVATAIPAAWGEAHNVSFRGHELDGPRQAFRNPSWGPQLLRVPAVERMLGGYDHGRYWFLLTDVEKITPPAPAKGKQGWWTWQPPERCAIAAATKSPDSQSPTTQP